MTVKELAIKYGVSEQAIRAFCAKNNIRKEIVQSKQGKRKIYCFDEEALKLIENHYTNESQTTQGNTTSKRKESNITQLLLDSLREQIRTLTAQLETKDKQIEEQNKQIAELHRLLDQEQQLHQSAQSKIPSAERNNKLIEAHETAPAPAEQAAQEQTQRQPRSEQRQQPTVRKTPKKGIFTNLFNRKGR